MDMMGFRIFPECNRQVTNPKRSRKILQSFSFNTTYNKHGTPDSLDPKSAISPGFSKIFYKKCGFFRLDERTRKVRGPTSAQQNNSMALTHRLSGPQIKLHCLGTKKGRKKHNTLQRHLFLQISLNSLFKLVN